MTSKHFQILAAVLLLLAAILGVVAWKGARQPPAPVPAQQSGKTQQYPVVVTLKPLEVGRPIMADQVGIEALPIYPTGAFSDMKQVVGREPIMSIGVGVPLIGSQLTSGLALLVEPGQRAVAMMVDEVIGVGNRVAPGDYVDLFLVVRGDGHEIPDSRARLLMSHLRVLAFGSLAVSDMLQRPDSGGTQEAPRETARTAVLAVPVELVSELAMAHQSGRLLMALRNPGDNAEPTVRSQDARMLTVASRNPMDAAQVGASLSSLEGRVRVLPPARLTKPEAGTRMQVSARPVVANTSVEVIRAGQREARHD